MTAAADRRLLFGLLALQNGLIDQGQLMLAFQAWASDKSQGFPDTHHSGRSPGYQTPATTNYPFRIAEPIQLGGLLGWSRKVVETFMFGQAQGAVAQAVCLLGTDSTASIT
jgi:hypothetical protein